MTEPVALDAETPARVPLAELVGTKLGDYRIERVLGYGSMGVEVMAMSQPEFAAYVKDDFEKWRQVARERNILVE